MNRRVYLDHNASTPVHPEVVQAMLPYFTERFGNPSSVHGFGREAREGLDAARDSVARFLGVGRDEVVFTSGGTESDNLAVKGVAMARKRGHVVTSQIEHHAVLRAGQNLEELGFEVTWVPVDGHGLVDPEVLGAALVPRAAVVSVAHASAEIGTLQDMESLAATARDAGVPLHCDATASAGLVAPGGPGRLPELVTIAPHLFGGPQGIAALRVARGHRLRPLIEGGTQEGGLRPGTQSTAAIAGFAAAARIALAERAARSAQAASLADELASRILAAVPGVRPTGHPTRRLAGHLSLCVDGVEAEALLRDLDAAGIEASSGSACATGAGKPSHVLEAIGIPPRLARGALTFMFGSGSRAEDPERIATALSAAAARLRALGPDESDGTTTRS
jgi:cysteine desulfurase